MQQCEICGKKFTSYRTVQKVCSVECRTEKERLRTRKRYYTEPGYKEAMFKRSTAWQKSQKGRDYLWEFSRKQKGSWGKICEICGESRFTESCHILARHKGGTNAKENILHLCPTHHVILDNWLNKYRGNQFTKQEYIKIQARIIAILPTYL